jgi:hypothetical protein
MGPVLPLRDLRWIDASQRQKDAGGLLNLVSKID